VTAVTPHPFGRDANDDRRDPVWFPVEVTDALPTDPAGYLVREVAVDGTGRTVPTVGGRANTPLNPAHPLAADELFAGDICLCRPAPMAGGLRWELARIPADGAGSGSGGSGTGRRGAAAQDPLLTVCLDVVTDVTCTADGGLQVTRQGVSITGRGLSVFVDPNGCGSGSGG
jgi:hypothetical protein